MRQLLRHPAKPFPLVIIADAKLGNSKVIEARDGQEALNLAIRSILTAGTGLISSGRFSLDGSDPTGRGSTPLPEPKTLSP